MTRTKEELEQIRKQYSKENIQVYITKAIEKEFGNNHNIKLVMFKANSEYNDEYNQYSPLLILIDNKYNEIDHKIKLWDLTPNEEDQYECYDVLGEDIYVEDITFKL